MTDRVTLSLGVWNQVFAVPTVVVDQHLKMASGVAFKVLLYLLRYSGASLGLQQTAQAVGYPLEEVRDAMQYWVSAGVFSWVQEEEMLCPAKTQTAVQEPQEETQPFLQAAEMPESEPSVSHLENTEAYSAEQAIKRGENLKILSTHPIRLTAGEIQQRCKEKPEIQFLFSEAERLLAKPLTPADMSCLVSLTDWAGLSVDLILMLISYCVDRGKTNLRYIEKVAIDWADHGIDSHEKAEGYIREKDNCQRQENLVRSAFGLGDRALTPKERKYIGAWCGQWKFDLKMIRLAYERTVDQTGKLSFPYCNSILKAWHEKGYHTPEEASRESQSQQPANRKTPSFDLEEFDRQSLMYPPKLKP